MKILFLVTLAVLFACTFAQSKVSNACAGCIRIEQACVKKCELSAKTVVLRTACLKQCTAQKVGCMTGCNTYTKCKLQREKVRRECRVTKSAGVAYVKNIKMLFKSIQSTRKDQLVASYVKQQQQHLAQARAFAAKYFECKKRLRRFNCFRPCVTKRCIKRRQCLLGCKASFKKCRPVCKKYKGSNKEVRCATRCYRQKTLCSRACRTRCGAACKYVKNCRIQCSTRFKNTLNKNCTKNLVPQCQSKCTPKCNKKCNMRDNEKCLLVCAAQCALGCYTSANRKCIKRSQVQLRVCRKKCVYRRVQVQGFDHKCGFKCGSVATTRFAGCNDRNKKACPARCTNLCKKQPCQTVACQADCNKKCNSGCFWLQRKTCFIFVIPKMRRCLRTCSGWTPLIEKQMVEIKKKEFLGTGHGKCHRNCAAKKAFDTIRCFMAQRHKCPMKCKGICKASKCTTDGCRERCSTKCSNTCYVLLKKKCSLLAQNSALTCLKKCPLK